MKIFKVTLILGSVVATMSFAHAETKSLEKPAALTRDLGIVLPSCPRASAYAAAREEHADALQSRKSPAETIWPPATIDQPESGAAAVLAAIAPALIDKTLDFVGAWLAKRAEADQASRNFTMSGYAAAPITSDVVSRKLCMVVVSGEFDGALGTRSAPGKAADESIDGGEWPKDWLQAFGLKNAPEFYAEFELEYSLNFDAMRLIPVWIEYRETGIDRRRRQSRALAVTAMIALNGVAAGAFAVPLANELKVGSLLTPEFLLGNWSAWLPVSKVALGLNSDSPATANILLETPIAAHITLVESVEPSEFDQLAQALFALTRPVVQDFAEGAIRNNFPARDFEEEN